MQKFLPTILFDENNEGKSVIAKRPEILNLQKILTDRKDITVTVDNAEQIKKVSFISTGSKTHSQGSEPKFSFLKFKN